MYQLVGAEKMAIFVGSDGPDEARPGFLSSNFTDVDEDGNQILENGYVDPQGARVSGAEDFFNLNGGDDSADGGGGEDELNGGAGNDTLKGGSGVDDLFPIDGEDTVYGGPDRDYIYDEDQFHDQLRGQGGDDVYYVHEESPSIVELKGQGKDTVIFIDSNGTLPANVENLVIDDEFPPIVQWIGTGNGLANDMIGSQYDDTLYGRGGNDTINGGLETISEISGDDRLYGGGGDDILMGLQGDDLLFGGADADLIVGGVGVDKLHGGGGRDDLIGEEGGPFNLYFDIFDYNSTTESKPGVDNRDVVHDFYLVGGDQRTEYIDLRGIDADPSLSGNQEFSFVGTADFTAPGQVRVVESGADTLIQANTTGTSGAEFEIQVRDGSALPDQWNALDFWL
jgi:serralysin